MKKKIVIIGLIVLVITLSVIFISIMDSNSSNKKEDYENLQEQIKEKEGHNWPYLEALRRPYKAFNSPDIE